VARGSRRLPGPVTLCAATVDVVTIAPNTIETRESQRKQRRVEVPSRAWLPSNVTGFKDREQKSDDARTVSGTSEPIASQPRGVRRPRGSGMVYAKDSIWMGKWYVRGKPIKRSLGPMRQPGSREGLTKTQAEVKLRELISASIRAPPPVVEGLSVEQVGTRLIKQLKAKGRKASTLENYESYLRVHLAPHFGGTPVSEVTVDDVEDFVEQCLAEHSIKSTRNYLGLLHGIFDFAIRKRWAHENPCRLAEKPEGNEVDRDIHFLDQAELEALLEAAGVRYRHNPETLQRAARVRTLRDLEKLPWKEVAARIGVAESTAIYLYRCEPGTTSDSDADMRRVERAMYLTAAMTGLRQGELFALRWMDIDWLARKVRVRRNYVRGTFGTPKSKRSSRAVPLADRVARELELLFQASAFNGEEDLVFGHPHTGGPLDRSQVSKRFKSALKRAGVREVRFHDLRHTFGTRCAANGVAMRTLQEWMGHRDIKTTQIYADYAPSANEVDLVNAAFLEGTYEGTNLRRTRANSDQEDPANSRAGG
jgi:integrase